jgi:D-hexose-6-phosphate mutarotase
MLFGTMRDSPLRVAAAPRPEWAIIPRALHRVGSRRSSFESKISANGMVTSRDRFRWRPYSPAPQSAMMISERGSAMQAATLTAEFGIAGILDFFETEHGLVKAVISLDGMAGEIYLQGAHLTAWQPRGGRPVLFTSPNSGFAPGRAIRGGIPIIFPWFGPSRHDAAAPQHGFARTAPWHLDGVETTGRESLTLSFSLSDNDVGSPFWPEAFRATYTVVLGQTLSLRLAVQNRATHPIIFEEALHAYFAISDITDIAISGLAGTTYIDKTDGAQPQAADCRARHDHSRDRQGLPRYAGAMLH